MPNPILDLIKDRPLLFDGAMGTMLMKAGQTGLKTPILLNLDEPELVTEIHRQYYAAGAEVVITNTFGGSPLKLAADGLDQQMAKLNREAVNLVRQACPDGKYVAGDIGPSGRMLKPLGDAALEDVQASFFSQAEVLIECGVDLIIIETMFSLEEALAAVQGVRKAGDILLLASMTYTKTPNGFFTMMGETVSQCTAALAEAGADMMGANCTLNSTDTIDLTRELRAATDRPILVQPNAGKPITSEGITYYEQTPAEFAADAKEMHAAGADMIGGCCGTTPEFIQEVKAVLSNS